MLNVLGLTEARKCHMIYIKKTTYIYKENRIFIYIKKMIYIYNEYDIYIKKTEYI